MSKAISFSSKKVLDVLLDQYNENSDAYHYYKLKGNKTSADQCMASMTTVCEILDSLGFKDGEDYETKYKDFITSKSAYLTIGKERIV